MLPGRMRTEPQATSPAPTPGHPTATDAGLQTPPDRAASTELPGDQSARVKGKPTRINWRRNLYAIFAAQLFAMIAFSMRAPFLPFFLGDLGLDSLSEQQLWSGIVNAGGAAMMAITAPIWGNLADRIGRRPMLIRAQVVACMTIAIMSAATSPWHILGLRMAEGALTGTVTAATALVAATVPKERLGYGLGLIQTAIFSGTALGPLIGGVLADGIGYRPTFLVASSMMLAGALISIFIVREQFTPHQRTADEPRPEAAWKLLMTPLLLGMTLAMFMIRGAEGAVQPIMSLYIEELSGMAKNASTLAGLTLGILGVTSAISAIFLGRLGDKRGYRTILLVSALGAGLIYLPMAAAQEWWHMFLLQAIFGVFAGGMIPSANALIARGTDPERRGVVYGMMATATSIGGVVGPLAGSGLAAGVGTRWTFFMTGLMLLTLVIILPIASRRTQLAPE